MAVWLVVLFLASGVLAQFPSFVTQDEYSILPPISPSSVTNQKCRDDILLYLQNLKNHTLWAVKMFDSSVKVPVGLLAGSTFQMGHFDECLQVGSEEAPTEVVPLPAPIRGQYCLARIQVSPLVNIYPNFTQQNVTHAFSLQYDPRGSMWEKFRVPIDPRKRRRDVFHWAVCVPSSCGPHDVRDGLNAALESLAKRHGVHLDVNVDDKLCQTADPVPYTTGDYVYLGIVGIAILLVSTATLYDLATYKHRQKLDKNSITRGQKMIIAFSAYTNLEKLNQPDPIEDLAIFHGVRVYSTVNVILSHRFRYTFGGPLFNPELVEKRYGQFIEIFFFNASIIVDVFFSMSGFLAGYSMIKTLNRSKKLDLPKLYIHRWLRLTPVYLMLIFFYITLLDNMGSGPFWKTRSEQERDTCVQNWWTNILYINNYVNSDKPCMFQTWYLASDMHFYLLAPLLIIPMYRKPVLGMIALVSALVISMVIPFVVTYTGSYNAIPRFYMNFLENAEGHVDFNVLYNKSHNRAATYIIGIANAFIYMKMKANNTKLSSLLVLTISTVSFWIGFASVAGAHIFFIPGREYSALENALYSPIHRALLIITMSWGFLTAATDNLGFLWPVQSIFRFKPFIPLSRLTYTAYLCHGLVQFYTMGIQKQPEDSSGFHFLWIACGDIMLTFGLAIIVHVLFEAPVTEFKKIFLEQRPPKQQTELNGNELENGTTLIALKRSNDISNGI